MGNGAGRFISFALLLSRFSAWSALPQWHEKRPSCLNLVRRLKQERVVGTVRLDGHVTSLG